MKLSIDEAGGTEDRLDADHDGKSVVITIVNPWSGNTEIGFGSDCSITLTPEKASVLVQYLIDFIEQT